MDMHIVNQLIMISWFGVVPRRWGLGQRRDDSADVGPALG